MNLEEEQPDAELDRICFGRIEEVNAYLRTRGHIGREQSYRSMPAAFRVRVLKNPGGFLKAASGSEIEWESDKPAAESPTPSRYRWSFKGVTFDFYRLLEILGITHHAQAHALKKVIRAGQSVKSKVQDIEEVIACLQRWREMEIEDSKK